MSDEPAAFSLIVPVAAAGERLDRFLAAQQLGLTRSQIQRIIDSRHVEVSREGRVSPSLRLRAGDEVLVHVPAPRPLTLESTPLSLDIVYEDRHLLVLNKPAGLVVHPGAGHDCGTLVHGLLYHCKDLSGIGGHIRPGIVHRLDKDTSGLLLVAKDDITHQALAAQFKKGRVSKTYLALARGRLREDGGRIEGPIGRHPIDRKRMSVCGKHGKPAFTEWRVLERLSHATYLTLRILTGRTHQIRVHLASIGHPILGDTLYGGAGPVRKGEPAAPRQMLHAASLVFTHPVTSQEMRCEAPIPADMQAVLDALRRIGAR